ncbi:MAG: hypothetical protein EHM46_02960 [Bacteroidetes bacterium]|nr:MAG: hypothetical protein EHM46_02960 [Bacteroidota bacterium]
MNKILPHTCAMIILLFLMATLRAQEADRKGKLYLVPEFWLSLGDRTYIDLAPQMGYHFFDRFSAGTGPHYFFLSQRAVFYHPESFQTHGYGWKVFTKFALITHAEEFLPINLFSDLFVHAEYEALSLEKARFYAPTYPDEGRFIYHGFLVGGGIAQRVGIYNSISIMILWDLNESSRSPYTNPEFRFGFSLYF